MSKRADEAKNDPTRRDLVTATENKSVTGPDAEPCEYTVAKVAIEDDFGARLVRRKGGIAKDIDLGVSRMLAD